MCVFAYSGVKQVLCCVFALYFFVLCAQFCQFLWIVHFDCPFGILQRLFLSKLKLQSGGDFLLILNFFESKLKTLGSSFLSLKLYEKAYKIYSSQKKQHPTTLGIQPTLDEFRNNCRHEMHLYLINHH